MVRYLFSPLLMFPEGFPVLVKVKMVGEGGYFCSCTLVLELELCPVACKRKQIIFKRKKKKPKYFLVSLFYPLHKWRNEKWEQLIFQVFTRNSTTMKRKEEMLLDPKVRPWISLKKVSVLIDQDLPRLLPCQMLSFHSEIN